MIKIGNNISDFSVYSCQPKTRGELNVIIGDRISKEGPNCGLNDIDVSLIEDMSGLFYNSKFNGDISRWNTSNVKDMSAMFSRSEFNRDISEWNVGNVTNMRCMFMNSEFNGDISRWDVSNVTDMYKMFAFSVFDQDISKWDINKDCNIICMFHSCSIKEEYKPKMFQV